MDISRVFTNKSEAVSSFFQQSGIGYYIPLYQREYSWDKENIDQLIEDICDGVCDLIDGIPDPIHFMGTLILVTEINPVQNIKPLDQRALPTRIDNVIDGQQRISTIAILACQLYQKLHNIKSKLSDDPSFDGLKEAIDTYLSTLFEIFSVDLKRGKPTYKPIIIRASVDQWTLDGSDDYYKSDVSSYLAKFIRAIQDKIEFPAPPNNGSLIGKNIKHINSLLRNVERAYELNDTDYPRAWDILDKLSEVDLWSYPRPDLVDRVKNRAEPLDKDDKYICSLVQIFAFCHYLLQRCCFTIIQPISDVRAFDMFQSLNATGTPLTAFETFKPLVVNFIETNGEVFKDSDSAKYLQPVDSLFSSAKNAAKKNKLTNEFLTLFALVFDGSKLSKQFSTQRRWLNSKYEECKNKQSKDEFIRRIGNLASYWIEVVNFKTNTSYIADLKNIPQEDREIASVCSLYIQKANHKMANTVLSRFFAQITRGVSQADKNFSYACKSVAAFFTIWRSALPNTGLDEVYRVLLRDYISWEKGDSNLTIQFISQYFQSILTSKGIGTKAEWLNRAKVNLRYDDALTVCRFVLFIVAQDTIPDPDEKGLIKMGRSGSTPKYLNVEQWNSNDLKSIEHVAPKNPDFRSSWDSELYDDDVFQRIGNLTLLPVDINSSLSNKGWIEKFIYYKHLAETDPENLTKLQNKAQAEGITLKESTVKLLKQTSTKQHITSLVQIGESGLWDKSLVEKRSERICSILWDRIYPWL
jgi:hypothetical protein